MQEVIQSNQNKKYFSQTCLEILNFMLDNIQKTQISENEDTYFDILKYFVFKTKISSANNIGSSSQIGVYKLMRLNPQAPFANGLEPLGRATS